RLRSVIFLEFTADVLPGRDDTEGLNRFDAALLRAQGFLSNDLSHWGVAPQAAFAVPRPLFEQCCRYASEQHVPFSCHAAESEEEWELFTAGKGRLCDYLAGRNIPLPERHPDGPLGALISQGLVPERMVLVHANYLTESSAAYLAGQQVSVVICPRSHFRFKHGWFTVPQLIKHGVNVCIGTESLAVTESLDMFEELYCLKRMAPELSNETILSMAVTGGARAAGLAGSVGQLRQGFLADVIGVELSHASGEDVLEELLTEEHEIRLVLVDGKEVIA
ncbi:MAG: amidohydrolase family protein, partial [Fibrobacterota bacterium]